MPILGHCRTLRWHAEGWGENPTPSGKENSPLASRRNSLYVEEDRGGVAASRYPRKLKHACDHKKAEPLRHGPASTG